MFVSRHVSVVGTRTWFIPFSIADAIFKFLEHKWLSDSPLVMFSCFILPGTRLTPISLLFLFSPFYGRVGKASRFADMAEPSLPPHHLNTLYLYVLVMTLLSLPPQHKQNKTPQPTPLHCTQQLPNLDLLSKQPQPEITPCRRIPSSAHRPACPTQSPLPA